MYTSQLGETAQYVENLSELNTENTIPTNNASQTENVFFEDGEKPTRMLTQKDAVANAKQKKEERYFVVKRIM
jgi:aspartyl/glutamyl-tRNA(Asn/Gln) amidotransferase C subunit